MRIATCLGLALWLAGVPCSARADDPPRREVPDYDSRADPAPDAVDGALWVPRIITGPLFLFSEYVIRVPLGALITFVQREGVVQWLQNVLTFGTGGQIGVFPTAFYEFGFLPSVGLYGFWNDLLTRGNRLSVHAATWGLDWLSVSARDRFSLGATSWFARGSYVRRPDYLIDGAVVFGGVGTLARYGAESVDAEVGYGVGAGHDRSYAAASVGGRWARFSDSAIGGPSLLEMGAQLGQPLPPGFAQGYTILALRGRLAVDTRDRTGVPSAGLRASAHGELARSIQDPGSSTWFTVGGQLLGATDFLGGRRTVALALEASTILTRERGLLPFDLSIDVGGYGPMQGFLPGQLRGLSGVALTLSYDWPVWLLLNARLYVATGGAFGLAFSDFTPDGLRLSFGFALRATDPGEHPFELGVSLGTDPFERGASVTTVRFFVGARNTL